MDVLSDLKMHDISAFSSFQLKRYAYMNDVAATAFTLVGLDTPTAHDPSDEGVDADGVWKDYQESTLNTLIGVNSAADITRAGFLPMFFARFKTPASLTNFRLAIGLTSTPGSSGLINSGGDSGLSLAEIWYSTNVHGTAFWRARTNDGSGSGADITTTSGIAVSTPYSVLVVVRASSVDFWINGEFVAQATSNIPSPNTNMGYEILGKFLAGGTKTLRIGGWMVADMLSAT